MQQLRRQVTLFLPEYEGKEVDSVHRKLDPKQHAIVGAHVTLCREPEIRNWKLVQANLSALLLHPRHAAETCVDPTELAGMVLPTTIRFTQLSVIEQIDGGKWKTIT